MDSAAFQEKSLYRILEYVHHGAPDPLGTCVLMLFDRVAFVLGGKGDEHERG